MKIVTAPNPILSEPAKSVEKIDSSVLKVINEMKKVLKLAKDPEGVGLAAPQIGKSLRIFLAKPTPKDEAMVFINPKIVRGGEVEGAEHLRARLQAKRTGVETTLRTGPRKSKPQKLEGCLSLKDIWGTVLRSPKVKISYLNEKGVGETRTFTGFLGTIIQHEYDHLNGVLFPRRVLEQKGKLYKSTKDENGEDIFEEIEI